MKVRLKSGSRQAGKPPRWTRGRPRQSGSCFYGSPAPHYQAWGTPGGPGPVALAFVGRTSTSTCRTPWSRWPADPPGPERLPRVLIARHYWDIESGGTDLDARSRHDVWQQYADAGIPRDGGMADLAPPPPTPFRFPPSSVRTSSGPAGTPLTR